MFLDTMRRPLESSVRNSGPYPYYGASGVVDYVDDYIFDEELVLLSEDGANITDRNYPVSFIIAGKCWVNNHAHVLKTLQKVNNDFICWSLEREDYSLYNTGMAMPKLNQDTCKAIPVMTPCPQEQGQIGAFFRQLDNLITLHQREGSALENLRWALLESDSGQADGICSRMRHANKVLCSYLQPLWLGIALRYTGEWSHGVQ